MMYGLILNNFKSLHYVSFFKYFLQYNEAFKQAEIAASYYWSKWLCTNRISYSNNN